MTLLSGLVFLHRHRQVRVYDENGILIHVGHMEDVRKCAMSLGNDSREVESILSFDTVTVFNLRGNDICSIAGTQESF